MAESGRYCPTEEGKKEKKKAGSGQQQVSSYLRRKETVKKALDEAGDISTKKKKG